MTQRESVRVIVCRITAESATVNEQMKSSLVRDTLLIFVKTATGFPEKRGSILKTERKSATF